MASSLILPGKPGHTPKLPKLNLPSASTMGAVIYTDGGARPNPGHAGWGVHGYLYNHSEPKTGTGCKKGVLTTCGYKADIGKEKPITVTHYLDGYGTIDFGSNNTAEMMGGIKALTAIIEYRKTMDIGRVVILPDSMYLLDGITKWVHGWIANGWRKSDGSEIQNLDLWKHLYQLTSELADAGVDIEWIWVEAHNGDIGNTKVDTFATTGVLGSRKQKAHDLIELSDAKGYWSNNPGYNRLISHSKWYFNTNVGGALRSPDGRYVYHLGNHGKDDELLGKRMSDARFSVLYLTEPIAVMEMVRAYQDQVTGPHGHAIIIGRLDNILNGDIHTYLTQYGDTCLDIYGRNRDIGMPDRTQLTKECTPARIASNAIETLATLQMILDQYREDPARYGFLVTDITPLLYEVETGKKTVCKLRKHITTALKSLDVTVNYNVSRTLERTDITLTFDIDLPDRNALSAIADQQPTVNVITWRESDCAFRYAVVVSTAADCGIYAGVYSNFKVLPLKK